MPLMASAPDTTLLPTKNRWRGDTRMNRAVQWKIDNPHLSLEVALQTGGFRYPPRSNGKTLDNENVSLRQRKNQLSRRVRQAKQDGEMLIPLKEQEMATSAVGNLNSPSTGPPEGPQAWCIWSGSNPALALTQDMAQATIAHHQVLIPSSAPGLLFSPELLLQAQYQPAPNSDYVIVNILMPMTIGGAVVQEDQTSSVANSLSDDAHSSLGQPSLGDDASSSFATVAYHEMSADPILFLPEVQADGLTWHASSSDPKGCAKTSVGDPDASLPGSQVHSEQADSDPRLSQALALFEKNCNMSLYQRAMLVAGFNSQESGTCSLKFQEFATMAWAHESNRLAGLFSASQHSVDTHCANKEQIQGMEKPSIHVFEEYIKR